MAKQANRQRVLAGLTTLALVASQVTTSAVAEVVSTGGEGVSAQATGDAQDSGTQNTAAPEAEPEAKPEAETQVDTKVETETAPAEENAALATASEDGDIMLASKTLTLNLHGGDAITYKDLYPKLREEFGGYDSFTIHKGTEIYGPIGRIFPGSFTPNHFGEYSVDGLTSSHKYENNIGTLQVNRTQTVTFKATGCFSEDEGGVIGAEDGEYPVGTRLSFETMEVPGYTVESVTVNGAKVTPGDDGGYSLTVGEEDAVVTVTYKPAASLSVETGNSTVEMKFSGTDYTASGNNIVEVPPEATGTLTVTPEDGYAVVSVNYNGTELPLSFSKGVATASLTSPYRGDLGSLKVTTAKCGLVTKGNATEFEVALAGSDPSEYKSLIYAAAIDTEGSVLSGLTADDVKIQYDAGVLWGPWEDLDYQLPDGIVGHKFDASEGKTEKIRVTFEGNEQYAKSSVEFTVKSVDGRLCTNVVVNDPVAIEYDADEDVMKASLYAQLAPKVYIEGSSEPVDGIEADDFEITGLEHKVGEQTVTVKFKGAQPTGARSAGTTAGLRPSERTVTVNVKRIETSLSFDGFDENDTRTTEYNGNQQPVTTTVLDKSGNVVEGATVIYWYEGNSRNGNHYESMTAPTDAGEYAVKATYMGDATYEDSSKTASFTILPAEIVFDLGTVTSVYGEEVEHTKSYSVNSTLLADDQKAAILGTVTCEGDDHNHDASADGYVIVAEVPESVAADKNLNVTIKPGTHIVTQRELKLEIADATKVSGQDNPTFEAVVYDGMTGEKLENQDEILKTLGVKLVRDEGEKPGTYKISADYANKNYKLDVAEGELTVLPSLTVEAKDGGIASADKAGAAKGEKVAVTAVPASDDYVFGGWKVTSGDAVVADPTAATTTVTMGSENATVVASFIAKTKATVNAGEGGSVYATPAKGLKGDTIKLVATASDGYVFSGWEVVSGDIKIADANAAETSFVLGEDAPVINAVFKKAATPAPADNSNNKKQQAEAAKAAEANTPETGDVINAYAPVAVGVAAAIVIAGAILVKRRNM